MEELSIRERIVVHTTGMFGRAGVKSVRMDDIAAEMGISKRTIYEIFGDREMLIAESMNYFHAQIHAKSEELARAADNIIDEYLRMLDVWDGQADAAYNIMVDVRKYYPAIYDRFMRERACDIEARTREKFRRGIEEGYLLERINIDLSISIIMYSLYGVMNRSFIMPANVSEREAFKHIVSHFIRGIATQKGVAMIDEYYEKKNERK
ncbi:MAG: TetR/AcrR family transcriptional regulator [Rikenellaceae bacterium]|nr:TetR/AcrR family transcriptional regulator [Rikenellaceae bacterium]MCL2692843.1 TetR/AcrR family transcriptional regulator [Rikenellaceae bacterium]